MIPLRLTGLTSLAAAALLTLLGVVEAQTPPRDVPGGSPPGVQDPRPMYGPSDRALCIRLENALAQLDSARGGDPETMRRYEDAIARQRHELDQTIVQGRRLGCDAGGGFFVFGKPRPPQCGQLDDQIRRMRANLDRMQTELADLRRGGSDLNRDLQRRQLISQLAQNDCGPQYRDAARPQPQRSRSLLEALFGGGWRDDSTVESGPLELPMSGAYRTVCVRTCDGFFFPISFSTVPSRFGDDENACRRLCPAAEVMLFSHRNPGEDMEHAISTQGMLYTELQNAFKYRQAYDPDCSCRQQGQSWAEALGVREDTLRQGDIRVTEERARQMSQPRQSLIEKGQAIPPLQQQAQDPDADDQPAAREEPPPAIAPGERRVRVVGPQFYPVR